MRDAVNFDNQLSVERYEIDDIFVDRMLAAEFLPCESSIT
jgi:hypothetical protein